MVASFMVFGSAVDDFFFLPQVRDVAGLRERRTKKKKQRRIAVSRRPVMMQPMTRVMESQR
jgi:hypothetical protein